jgi:hypothetical protein
MGFYLVEKAWKEEEKEDMELAIDKWTVWEGKQNI